MCLILIRSRDYFFSNTDHNGVNLILIIKRTPLHNENSPITDPITEMGVAQVSSLPSGNALFFPDLFLKPWK